MMKLRSPFLRFDRVIALGFVMLTGCSAVTVAPSLSFVPEKWSAPLPSSPLPHDGQLVAMSGWWQRLGDPLLVELINDAEQVSPNLAAAASRLAQARAVRTASGAAQIPTIDGALTAQRASQQLTTPTGTVVQASLQAAWEIDLFGAQRAARDAAQARLQGAQADWHDARIVVAAEVANQYYSLRACEQLARLARNDADSRSQSASLAQLAATAGFQSPVSAGLARANAAQGNSLAIVQKNACEADLNALVALTAVAQDVLRARLAQQTAELPQTVDISVEQIPAHALVQRPDVRAAEQAVYAARADLDVSKAQRYPRLALSGAIGAAQMRSNAGTMNLDTWSLGPLSLTVPLFDGGRRAANVSTSEARNAEAEIRYRAVVRQAVREVEQALLNLHGMAERSNDARIVSEGFQASFDGTASRANTGLASQPELEEARRLRLAAESAWVVLQRERLLAWIVLYRATGGGWQLASQPGTLSPTPAP